MIAMTAAAGFFVLAAIGWASGLTVWECSLRSGTGAFALYVVLRVAGWLAASIVASAAVGTGEPKDQARSDGGVGRT